MEFKPTIGLEIHAELKTKTKMFCDCLNNPEEKIPNKNICPTCIAHPGTLPVINKKALEQVILVGLALNSEIPEYSKFDRKNYFYPDLPKGYQISQYDMPLCKGGELSLFLSNDLEESKKKIKITRVHLEEDTGKLIHSADGESTLIDFNRAGVPLMELVTEPVIHTGKEARLFAQGLQLLFRTLGVSEADMERGQMRCEVNISLAKDEKLGTKVEIKNLNSFRVVEKSIDFEIQRQKGILEKGEKVVQETRGWDAEKEITYSQRLKEEAQDYRYFPEPDLPRLHIYSKDKSDGLFDLEKMKKQIPELPWQKKERIKTEFNLSSEEANQFIQDEKSMIFFEQVIGEFDSIGLENKEKTVKLAYNYLTSDLKGLMESESITWGKLKITSQSFAQLIIFLSNGKISSRAGKDILAEMLEKGGKPEEIIKAKGLEKISDKSQLEPIILEIIKNNPKTIEDYKKGKENALQFLVGQAMAKTRGAADPKSLEKLFKEQLS
jgi:aspartyl-tRNA(Asn)/glutamyl-tRNA(Gln) amidotransferase subunit B